MSAAEVLRTVHAEVGRHRRKSMRKTAGRPYKLKVHAWRPPLRKPYLSYCQEKTEWLLHRYLHASMQAGRTASPLDGMQERGRVSSRALRAFDDAVIFARDMEVCLLRLNRADYQMLLSVALEGYTQQEAALLWDVSVRTFVYQYLRALDRLTEMLLERQILRKW